jgi:nucleotide-binding universal stress UspA family protein
MGMNILVGFDGSNSSIAALDLACTYAKSFDATIEIVTSMAEGDTEAVEKIREAETQLAWAESHVSKAGITANTHLLIRGMKPGEDIVHFADENNVDVTFIGVRRRSKVGKLLFGSNAQFIVLKAPCPVMTVK